MEQTDDTDSPPPIAIVVFIAVIAACTIIPWIVHFLVGWWAGILAWLGLVAIYDKLFVPKGSLCMGMHFMFPLCSFMLLLGFNILNLVRWIF
jgi:hypothetical protein